MTIFKWSRRLGLLVFLLVFLTFSLVVLYSIKVFKATETEKEGITVCQGNVCEKSWHIHSAIEAKVCGQHLDFAKNAGKVSDLHTHSEDNLIHFHNRLKVDAQTGEILDTSPLKLGRFFEGLKIPFSSSQLAGYSNGDRCDGGRKGRVKMTVNGQANQDFENYVWSDGDKIEVVFD